jgi:hypothetical protein
MHWEASWRAHTIYRASFVYRIDHPGKNIRHMENAHRPFIGIIIVTIAILYSVIALLS